MSQQLRVSLICDMSPHETETQADRTVTLGIDGRYYELEMCAKHELQLRTAALTPTRSSSSRTSAAITRCTA